MRHMAALDGLVRAGTTSRRTAGALLAAAVAAGAAAALATPAGAATCPPPPATVQPFLPWQDAADYVTVNNGSFEPLAKGSKETPWKLSAGASVVGDNEPWHIDGGSGDSHALYLPAGSTAVSACTTAPNISSVARFFVRNVGAPDGRLHVEVLVNGGKNGILDGGTITAGSAWQVSQVVVLPWAKPLKGAVDLRVRLTPVGDGAAFVVDDVYLDPFRSK
jgi:hypothetical protein